jgi:hypothetical protein
MRCLPSTTSVAILSTEYAETGSTLTSETMLLVGKIVAAVVPASETETETEAEAVVADTACQASASSIRVAEPVGLVISIALVDRKIEIVEMDSNSA